jgi:hypothetical protein
MKLANRFSEEVKQYWAGWYECQECGRNHADCLHHILSGSSPDYVKGNHNESILNSCPLNNHDCHLYKPLHSFAKQKELLLKVKNILDQNHYKYNELDKKFLLVYKKYYVKI